MEKIIEKTFEFSDEKYYGQVIPYMEKKFPGLTESKLEDFYYVPAGASVGHDLKDGTKALIGKAIHSRVQVKVFSDDEELFKELGELEKLTSTTGRNSGGTGTGN